MNREVGIGHSGHQHLRHILPQPLVLAKLLDAVFGFNYRSGRVGSGIRISISGLDCPREIARRNPLYRALDPFLRQILCDRSCRFGDGFDRIEHFLGEPAAKRVFQATSDLEAFEAVQAEIEHDVRFGLQANGSFTGDFADLVFDR